MMSWSGTCWERREGSCLGLQDLEVKVDVVAHAQPTPSRGQNTENMGSAHPMRWAKRPGLWSNLDWYRRQSLVEHSHSKPMTPLREDLLPSTICNIRRFRHDALEFALARCPQPQGPLLCPSMHLRLQSRSRRE